MMFTISQPLSVLRCKIMTRRHTPHGGGSKLLTIGIISFVSCYMGDIGQLGVLDRYLGCGGVLYRDVTL